MIPYCVLAAIYLFQYKMELGVCRSRPRPFSILWLRYMLCNRRVHFGRIGIVIGMRAPFVAILQKSDFSRRGTRLGLV